MNPLPEPIAPRRDGFNAAINGFRGLCVLLVFVYHVANSNLPGSLTELAAGQGVAAALAFIAGSTRYGVEMFFMISGLVIIGSLRRHQNAKAFLRDRCIRIFPAWVPLCLLMFVVGLALKWRFFATIDATQGTLILFGNLLLLPPLVRLPMLHPATWSVTYEWLFYVVAASGFWLWYSSPARNGESLNRESMVKSVAWTVLWTAGVVVTLYFMPRGIWFIVGVMVALGWTPWSVKSMQRHSWLHTPWLSMLVFLWACRMLNFDAADPGAHTLAEVGNGYNALYMLLAFVAALHFFSVLAADNTASRALYTRPMQLMGDISYSFYLWHPIVMFAVKPMVSRWVLPHAGVEVAVAVFALLSMLLSLMVSWLSYRWLEQGVGRWLRSRTVATVAAPPGPLGAGGV